ncbi:hypothetical protein HOY34_11070 [Xinfangfangia sp. D13-10-4-6]|uniref:hypothetical protein n=1 Tax=Pseudogemmobacter hezensis TaxID=2737662 RepID=UPI001551FD7B|nr:hypothetical protein [Pseudogemmobacter hezensis]NPD15743.1 hypothetical protein [Pseudogemmobacter hezensis]
MAASSIIGALRVNLGLDSAQFSRGVKQVQTRVGALADSLNKRLGGLGNIPGIRQLQGALSGISANAAAAFGAMAGTATAALGVMSISAINSAKELQNLSRLANATPEEFQRMAYAADQVGISQEKFSDILKDVNDRVGDFVATGGGPMADFFERIAPKVGVTADHFRKLSGPQALQLYVDSLEKANVNQQDFTFFMEAMASDSTALLPVLRNGGKLAQEYGDRLAALGGVRSNETVARLAAMKTALGEVGVVMTGLKNQIGTAFAPIVEAAAKWLVKLLEVGSPLRIVIDGLTGAIGWLASGLSAIANITIHVWTGIWEAVKAGAAWINQTTGIGTALQTVWDWTFGALGKLVGRISNLLDAVGGIGNAFVLLGKIASGVWNGIVETAKAIPTGLQSIWASVKASFFGLMFMLMQKWSEFVTMMYNTTAGTPIEMDLLRNAMNSASAGLTIFKQAEIDAADEAETLGASFKGAIADGFKPAQEALAELWAGTEKTKSAMDEATDTAGGLGGGLDALANKAGGGAAKLTKLQEIMKSLREEASLLRATFGMSDLDAEIWAKQREAGVQATSVQGQQIAGTMTLIDRMKSLKSSTDEWRDSMKGAFASFVTGASSFKDMIGQIIGKLAEMLANSAFDKLFAGFGGGGKVGGFLSLLGFDGGGYTGSGPRTGGVDGKGGFPAILHPQETVIDHTKGQTWGGGTTNVQVVPSPYFDTVVDGRIRRASPSIISGSVQASSRAARQSKSFFGRGR